MTLHYYIYKVNKYKVCADTLGRAFSILIGIAEKKGWAKPDIENFQQLPDET